ncbi:MAG: polysaccharide pyruvyl transferase family protein [Pseudobutyrivibrio ruminis]|nr:polysaccharide pyruvyl transferase family protein [Pseudobutyrivibrio ruminis]
MNILKFLLKVSFFGKNKFNINCDIDKKNIILLDTSIGSDNLGDSIIMDYIVKHFSMMNSEITMHIPTHICDEKKWKQLKKDDNRIKILCGTNLLYGNMFHEYNLAYPTDIRKLNNCCLCGVGWGRYEDKINTFTRQFLKYMLNNSSIHSVRDSYTLKKLESIGINNVVFTSCPSMWNLTPDFCKDISPRKSNIVVTTVTDYCKDVENDKFMLDFLLNHYDEVAIWIQGRGDYSYLSTLKDIKQFKILSSLEDFDNYLKKRPDYVGTRLHAGIRALNFKCRSLIISVDNRAKEISKDTCLPIIERNYIKSQLEDRIYANTRTEICIPQENIDIWKSQFK